MAIFLTENHTQEKYPYTQVIDIQMQDLRCNVYQAPVKSSLGISDLKTILEPIKCQLFENSCFRKFLLGFHRNGSHLVFFLKMTQGMNFAFPFITYNLEHH